MDKKKSAFSKKNKIEKTLLYLVLILFFVSLVNMAYQINHIYTFVTENDKAEGTHIKTEAIQAAENLDKSLNDLKIVADNLAYNITKSQLKNEEIVEKLRIITEKNKKIFALGVAFAPYEYKKDTKLFCKYYTRKNNALDLIDIGATENYLEYKASEDWYRIPMLKGPIWMEPAYVPEINSNIVEYSVPFYKEKTLYGEKIPAGIIFIDYSMTDVKQMLYNLDLGKNGYGFILSKGGKFIAHPNEEYVKAQKSIFDIADELKSEKMRANSELAIKGKSGTFKALNEISNQPSRYFYTPIGKTGWSLGVVNIQDDINTSGDKLRKYLIIVVFSINIFLMMAYILLFKVYELQSKKLWSAIAVFGLLTILGIGITWFVALNYTPYKNSSFSEFTEISDSTTLKKATELMINNMNEIHEKEPIYIPTGIFIKSIGFVDSSDVSISGYIWQKYKKGIHDNLEKNIVFPDNIEGELTDAYKSEKDGIETIGWSFKAVIRQKFDYSRYPFDNKNIWLRMWSADFKNNVVLIPDLESYNLIKATALPGIEKNIAFPGWDIERTFFSFVKNSYNTDFGIDNNTSRKLMPELCYTIIIKRSFLAPFITYTLPLIVLACIVFAVLLMVTESENKKEMFQFSITSSVAACSGLFFSVLLAHSQLRNELKVNTIIYIEYLCFILYFAILLVAVNSFMFGLETKIRFIKERDNIIPKLLYWPIILGLFLCVTIYVFY